MTDQQQTDLATSGDDKDYLQPLQQFVEEITADRDRVKSVIVPVRDDIRKAIKEIDEATDDCQLLACASGIKVALSAIDLMLDESVESGANFQSELARLTKLNVESLHAGVEYLLDEGEAGEEGEEGEEGDYDEEDEGDEITDSVLMPGDGAMISALLQEYLQMLMAGVSGSDPNSASRQLAEARITQIRGLIARVQQITLTE